MLRVVDSADLSGTDPNAYVTRDRRGSTDIFMAPLPTELTQLAVAKVQPLRLRVNGVPAACAHPSGLCTFAYDSSSTAAITAVSPATLVFGNGSSVRVNVTGARFSADLASEVSRGGGALRGGERRSCARFVQSLVHM